MGVMEGRAMEDRAMEDRAMEGGMDGKQRCSQEGCRAWARRQRVGERDGGRSEGRPLCGVHSLMAAGQRVGAPRGNQNKRKHGLYASYVPVVALKQALELPPGDLRLEIAVTRAALARVMRLRLPEKELIDVLEKGSATLVRLMRTQKYVGDAGSGDLKEAMGRALVEMGLGEL